MNDDNPNGSHSADLLKLNKAEAFLDRIFPTRDIRRVLLVNPPDADATLFRSDTARRKRYHNYPPYGLGLIAENLRALGIECRISNLNHEVLKRAVDSSGEEEFPFDAFWKESLQRDIWEFQPDFIGITCMFTMTHSSFRQVCAYAVTFGVPIGIGGVHVSNDVERVLDDIPQAQVAFLQEGDLVIRRFVDVVRCRAQVSDLGQVILNDPAERLRFVNEARPSNEDISVIPSFDLMKVEEYSSYGTIGAFHFLKAPGTRIATALSNRGCRAQCTFCSVRNFNGMGVRLRSISSVVDELELLRDKYSIDHVMWLDDDLLRDHKRVISLFNEMVRRRLGMTWDATNGVIAASCTDEVIAAAAESGCIAMNIGVESGNPKILLNIKKPGRIDTFLKASEVLRKHESIHVSVFLMIGFPNETMSMVLDTINLAKDMGMDWYRISPLQPLPNTPIYDSMVAQGLIQDVGSLETRYMNGAYGKQGDIEAGRRMTSPHFEEAFHQISMDSLPTGEQLTDIWFYMNFHLNFRRLFAEDRPVKIDQQMKNMRSLCDRVAPENGFALYFLGFLQNKVQGKIDPEIIHRLENRLETSPYWQDRFHAFGLSLDDLKTGSFESAKVNSGRAYL